MSQYPSPYGPPPQGYPYYYGPSPDADLLRPARRASNLMIVLGSIGLLLGTCFGTMSQVSITQLPPEQRDQYAKIIQEAEQQAGMAFKTLALIGAAVVAIPSILLIGLAIPIRRGARGWTTAGLVLVGLITLAFAWQLAAALLVGVQGQTVGGSQACMLIVAFAAFVALITWLVQARRASARLAQLNDQYQSQYWQQMQQGQWGQWPGQYPQQQVPPPPPGQPPVQGPPQLPQQQPPQPQPPQPPPENSGN